MYIFDGTITYAPYTSLDDTSRYDICRITQGGKLLGGVKTLGLPGVIMPLIIIWRL